MYKKYFHSVIFLLAILIFQQKSIADTDIKIMLLTHKTPTCGCCKEWVKHAKDNGLIVRAIGDVIAFCPPLIITDPQINDMFDIVEHSLKLTMDDLTKKGLIV